MWWHCLKSIWEAAFSDTYIYILRKPCTPLRPRTQSRLGMAYDSNQTHHDDIWTHSSFDDSNNSCTARPSLKAVLTLKCISDMNAFLLLLLSLITRASSSNSSSCTEYTNIVSVGLTNAIRQNVAQGVLKYVSTNTWISMEFNVSQKGWIGVGRSPSGMMSGSLAVVGQPDSGLVSKYLFDGYDPNLSSSSTVSITNASVTQTNSSTTLRFVQTLKEERMSIDATGSAMFIFAIGCDNAFAHHCGHASVQLDLSPCMPMGPSQKPSMKPSKPSKKPSARPSKKSTRRPTLKPVSSLIKSSAYSPRKYSGICTVIIIGLFFGYL